MIYNIDNIIMNRNFVFVLFDKIYIRIGKYGFSLLSFVGNWSSFIVHDKIICIGIRIFFLLFSKFMFFRLHCIIYRHLFTVHGTQQNSSISSEKHFRSQKSFLGLHSLCAFTSSSKSCSAMASLANPSSMLSSRSLSSSWKRFKRLNRFYFIRNIDNIGNISITAH